MHFPSTNTKYFFCKIVAIVLLTAICANGHAQSTEALPDSVAAADGSVDTISSSADVSNADTTIHELPVLRQVPDTTVQANQRDPDFAYANDPEYWKKEPVTDNGNFFRFFDSIIVRYILYLLIAGVIIYAVYRIVADNKIYLFYSSPKKIKSDGQDVVEDIAGENLDEKIAESIRAKDFRLAVRYMYLKALMELDKRGLIKFHTRGTDQQYLAQFSKHNRKEDFRYLTNVYEYTWYGNFGLSQQQAENVHQKFNSFYSSIQN